MPRYGQIWMLLILGFGAGLCLHISTAQANSFVAWQYVQGVYDSDAQWGDFDGDGDLDLVVCGTDVFGTRSTRTYENVGGAMTWHQDLVGIDGLGSGCLAWGDYDGDGDLDLALAGESSSGPTARIYQNDGTGHLTWDMGQLLTGVLNASAAWGDHDGDGDLDLLVMGDDGATQVTAVYENDPPGTLSPDPTLGLTGLASGSADWADWDGDGDLDLLLTGYRTSQRLTVFYKNDAYGLVNDGNHGLPGIALSDAAWGDYDTDGDLDLAFTGETQSGTNMARVYRNDGAGNFTQIVDVLPITQSSCAWGDYDNDGYQDVAFSGTTGTSLQSAIYRYTGTTFAAMFSLRGLRSGSASWADVDLDGDLDFMITGMGISGPIASPYGELYENRDGVINTPPTAPTNLAGYHCKPFGLPGSTYLHLSWDNATDAETAAAGLYYCLRVGTSPGGTDLVSGTYGTPLMGNVGQITKVVVPVGSAIPGQSYFWSVRTIDAGLLASAWAPEQICELVVVDEVDIDPADDAFVDLAGAGSTYGTIIPTMLMVGEFGGTGDIARSYLRFGLSGIPADATIIHAELQVFCTGVLGVSNFYTDAWAEMSNSWDENTITWNTAPTQFYGWPSDRSRATPLQNSTWNVTSPVTGNLVDGWITLVLRAGSPPEGGGGLAEYESKESPTGPGPRLRIIYWHPDLLSDVEDSGRAPAGGAALLKPNIPNPFNPRTTITYTAPHAGPVSLEIFDARGRRIRNLVDAWQQPGQYSVEWNGRDGGGRCVGSGVYCYRLVAGEAIVTRTMTLVR
ncbi:MAG: FG-GAP-like repeat-containing protein [bacterium]